jgi:hypothetical protein
MFKSYTLLKDSYIIAPPGLKIIGCKLFYKYYRGSAAQEKAAAQRKYYFKR